MHNISRHALLWVVVLLQAAPVLAAPQEWVQYTHPQLGFSLSYPKNWAPTQGVTGIAFMTVGPNPAGVADLRLSVNVTMEQLPPNTTVEEYDAQNESGMGLLFQGYRRLRVDRTKIGSVPALLRYYTWKRNDGIELYQMQLVAVVGNRGYVVTGTTASTSKRLMDEAKLLVSILLTFRPR